MKFISRLSVIAVIILSVTFLYACGKIDDSINDKGNKTESKIEIVDDSQVFKAGHNSFSFCTKNRSCRACSSVFTMKSSMSLQFAKHAV